MKTILVAAVALIDPDRRILLAERPAGKPMAGLWEFPGGKVEPGELPEDALIREIREEIGVELCHACLSPGPFVSYRYTNEPPRAEPGCDCPPDVKYFVPASTLGLAQEFHLLMPLFLCRKWRGTPAPHEGQRLIWRDLRDMAALPMPPADRPLVEALRAFL